jgi:alkylation response protein AidB-like acyl-CoA dehydrogenase
MADALQIDRPVYRVPPFIAQALIAAILVGGARAGLDALIDQASSRVSSASGQSWRDWPGVQDTVASCSASLRAARAGLLDVADEIWDTVSQDLVVEPRQRGAVYSMTDNATRTARECISRLYTAGSIDALHRGHGLERALRDVHAMSVNWERYKQLHLDHARVLLGLEPTSRIF